MRAPRPLLFLLCIISAAFALDLKGRIQWNEHCAGLDELGQAKVVLDNGKMYGGVTQDGGFTIPGVPAGTYIMSVVSHDHSFDRLRVDVLDMDTVPEIRPYIPGTPLSLGSAFTLPYPITLSAVAKLDYYSQQQAFNILEMFKNPMMLMMVFGAIMVFATPYLMKQMDPEIMKDFEQRQSRISGLQSQLQSGDLRGSLSTLMTMTDEDATAATSARPESRQSQTGSRQRTGRNKRR